MPWPIIEIFGDESLCSNNTVTGTKICNLDFSVLPIEVITLAEDECQGLGVFFHIIDYISGDEEVVEIGTAVPNCFGTCSEDQIVFLLEKAGATHVKFTKEPNEEPNEAPNEAPNEDISSTWYIAGWILVGVFPFALLAFQLKLFELSTPAVQKACLR